MRGQHPGALQPECQLFASWPAFAGLTGFQLHAGNAAKETVSNNCYEYDDAFNFELECLKVVGTLAPQQ